LESSTGKCVVLLGDGADWIWRYGAKYPGGPDREVIEALDLFHPRGHRCEYAKAYFSGEAAWTAWMTPLSERLETEGPVLAAMTVLEAEGLGADLNVVRLRILR